MKQPTYEDTLDLVRRLSSGQLKRDPNARKSVVVETRTAAPLTYQAAVLLHKAEYRERSQELAGTAQIDCVTD